MSRVEKIGEAFSKKNMVKMRLFSAVVGGIQVGQHIHEGMNPDNIISPESAANVVIATTVTLGGPALVEKTVDTVKTFAAVLRDE